ncbi:sericin 1-like [Capsicum annuum]
MAKVILLYVVEVFMIFPLFWNHGNATTHRKLGARHNAVTGLTNIGDATFRGLGFPRELGSHQNTNEAISGGLGLNDSPISSLLAQGERQFGIPCFSKTKFCDIRRIKTLTTTSGGSEDCDSPISRSSDHANEATSSGSKEHDSPISRSSAHANKATSGGSEDHDSPISSASTHKNSITIPYYDPNEAITSEHGTHQEPNYSYKLTKHK